MKKKKLGYVILAIALLLLVTAIYIYREYNRTKQDTALIKPDYSTPVMQLISEFNNDETKSNKKYWDKVIELTGRLKQLNADEGGAYTLVLGDSMENTSIRCSMDSLHNQEAKHVKEGETVKVKGICTGYNKDELLGSDVILVRCVLVKN